MARVANVAKYRTVRGARRLAERLAPLYPQYTFKVIHHYAEFLWCVGVYCRHQGNFLAYSGPLRKR